MIVGSYDASSSEGPLLSSYVSIGIHYASDRESTAVPLMLSIQPTHNSSVIGNLRVMAVNRSSKNADAAMNLLTYLAVNRSDYQKSLFSLPTRTTLKTRTTRRPRRATRASLTN